MSASQPSIRIALKWPKRRKLRIEKNSKGISLVKQEQLLKTSNKTI